MLSITTVKKAELRASVRAKLKSYSPAQFKLGDNALFHRFLSLPQVRQAKTVLLYYGMNTEPDTARLLPPLWSSGKQLCLPRCLPGNQMEIRCIARDSKLILHPWGMLEPGEDCPLIKPDSIDLALIPGLAFDRSGGRLGQGGGFYDRWLTDFHGLTVALCRDAFLLDEVPREAHDRCVDLVLTETAVYGLSPLQNAESGAKSPAPVQNT